MTRYVALLQGVNVGGRRKVPMEELRELAAGLGWRDVRTHLASGNAVFDADDLPPDALAQRLSEALDARFGFAVPVVVRTGMELRAVVEQCPYPAGTLDASKLLVYFLDVSAEGDARLLALNRGEFGRDEWQLRGREIYAHFPEGSGRSKLGPALVRALPGYVVTSRNWRTVTTLLAMAGN